MSEEEGGKENVKLWVLMVERLKESIGGRDEKTAGANDDAFDGERERGMEVGSMEFQVEAARCDVTVEATLEE